MSRRCHHGIDSPEPNVPALARVPPGLDLTGAVVVLTHPRTGSSLLMQTLRLLGADVLGEAERAGMPSEANPRGYYEHAPVLLHGLRAAALADQPALLRGRTFKLSLIALVGRRDVEEWRRLLQPEVALLLPIRSPAESLRSQEVLLLKPEAQARRALHHIVSVRQHLVVYAALSRLAAAPAFHGSAPTVFDYPLALSDPAAYVERVACAARLHPAEAQRAAAIANIDHSLHRYTTPRVQAEQPASERAALLEAVYQLLRRDDADKWSQLRDQLPAWSSETTKWLGDAPTASSHAEPAV